MSILFYTPICELTNHATEMLLEKYYDPDNVLFYDLMEECEFNPKIKLENMYDVKDMHNRNYRSYKDYYSFPPVDEQLLNRMSLYESEVYKMMNLYFPPLRTFDDRQRLYFSVLRLCNGIIERNHISLFIMYGPPHQIFDYVIYCLCKTKGIPTIMTWRMPVVGYTYYYYNLMNHLPDLENNENILITEDDLKGKFKDDYLLHKAKSSEGIRPYYMSSGSVAEKLSFFKDRTKHFLKYGQYFRNLGVVVHLQYLMNKKNKYIARHSSKPDYDAKYIYYALHYQPEATTSPSAGVFTNQQLAIQMLSYYVPEDVFIYVKEHPNQRMRGERFDSFFAELSELRNVKIMPRDASSNELQEHALAVATCTGTVAYEMMYKKKASLLFGDFLYNYAPGSFTIKNNEDCIEALKAVQSGVIISDQEIISYLFRLQSNSYHAEYTIALKDTMREQGVSQIENNETFFRMICNAIDGARKIDG